MDIIINLRNMKTRLLLIGCCLCLGIPSQAQIYDFNEKDDSFQNHAAYVHKVMGIEVSKPSLFDELGGHVWFGAMPKEKSESLGEMPFLGGPTLESKDKDGLLIWFSPYMQTCIYFQEFQRNPNYPMKYLRAEIAANQNMKGEPATWKDVQVFTGQFAPENADSVYVLTLKNTYRLDSLLRKHYWKEGTIKKSAPLKYAYQTTILVTRKATPTMMYKLFTTKEVPCGVHLRAYIENVLAGLSYPSAPKYMNYLEANSRRFFETRQKEKALER